MDSMDSLKPAMNITIDQRSLNHLHRLWRSRAKVLHEAAALVPDGPLADKIKRAAEAYGQCAEELESPPARLFAALGYDEPSTRPVAHPSHLNPPSVCPCCERNQWRNLAPADKPAQWTCGNCGLQLLP